MTNRTPPLHATLRDLVAEHGLQEVMRVLQSVARFELRNPVAASQIGQARQLIHLAGQTEKET